MDVEVKYEDQQNINVFNRLNQRMHEVEAELAAKKSLEENIDDADNELMLADDEEVRFVIGECFFRFGMDEGQERLSAEAVSVKAATAELDAEMESVKGKMKDLKTVLYGKFGSAINLEE